MSVLILLMVLYCWTAKKGVSTKRSAISNGPRLKERLSERPLHQVYVQCVEKVSNPAESFAWMKSTGQKSKPKNLYSTLDSNLDLKPFLMAEDVSRRSKLIQTFWLFWAFNHRGIQTSFLGPTLLDLQLLLQKDLNALSYLFFACGLGSMLGALAAGVLASRFDLRLQLFLSLMVGSASLAAIPQVHHIVYVYIMVFVTGTTSGLVICFVMLLCGELWERKGPPFHFVACGMSTGAIIAPLIAKTFLSSRQPVRSDSFSNLTNALSVNATSIGTVLVSIISQQDKQDEDTRVQWAFFVIGCCILPAGLSQLYYWLVYRSEGTKKKTESSEYTELNHHQLFKWKPIFVAFYVNLFVMYFLISALPVTYSSILTVYGVQGPLHMAKAYMLTMTSLFFIGSLSSRIIKFG
ncbi:sodium-dependent glucose transporter 1-like [Haliotis rufescens]|uniref:sodium-dependent glucose transporter 1-like n=1 Tax=Haliotis rufescens TaxID=6454 RepID=UPI00201EB81E|nr:sodium-dependent glucose transporter 1-like [Haliotis rufescens]